VSLREKVREVEERLEKIPRLKLGFFPTPLHRLDTLSKELDIDLYVKRDDLTGPSAFGGNKIRKLEFLLADAINKKAEYVFTYGATQSNHAMLTAAMCRKCGLKPVLFLSAIVPPREGDYRANLLLDKIFDADIHILPMRPGMTMEEAAAERDEAARALMTKLEKEGHKCYDIPAGGANVIGGIGFVSGFVELTSQLLERGIGEADYVVHATGSGGTLSGLLAGRALIGSKTKIISFASGPKPVDYPDRVAEMANDVLKFLGFETKVSAKDILFDDNYVGEGYEKPTDASTKAIRLFAQKEGILFDPVYTAKALSGLLDYVSKGKIPPKSKVVFWHTGGTTALFSEKEIVGRVYG